MSEVVVVKVVGCAAVVAVHCEEFLKKPGIAGLHVAPIILYIITIIMLYIYIYIYDVT